MVKQYVGARYVPKFASPLEWAADTSYEALTIVTFNNASYTSKIQVPPTVGNPANNPKYWALTGNYNAQVEQYRQETETVSNNLTTEITNRENADTTLQGQITTEITNRGNADTALQDQIATEITHRVNADATLQNNIDAEANARQTADNTLQGNILNAVQAAVTNEKNERVNADNSLRKAIDTINGSPSGSSIVVDKSLSIDGAGADAKTVGDILKNVDLLAGGTEIPAGSDLNDYKKVGNYYVISDTISSSIENIPERSSGLLKVYRSNGIINGFNLTQHYISSNSSKGLNEYKRIYYNNTWYPWVKVAGTVDKSLSIDGAGADAKTVGDILKNVDLLAGGTEIPAGSDFNDYTEVGNYYVISDAISNSIENIPTHTSGLLKVYRSNGDLTSSNRTQHFISSSAKHANEYKRIWYLNTWYPWVKVAGINVSHASMYNKLTVMTYNVQCFMGRNANTIMQDAIIRKFNPDIIGLQEFREYTPADFDVSVTTGMDVWSTIFKDYEYTHLAKEGNVNYKGNASKFEMTDIVDKAFNVNNGEERGYTKCYIIVNGKKICWVNAHLATTALQADKIAQANQIVELVKDEPYFIVTGDFNTRNEPELGEFNSIMKPFLDIGANTANFKTADNYIFTYCDGRDFSSGSKQPNDNIITSANISIDKVFADNTKYMPMFMDSNPLDHVPLVAFLTIN